MPRPAPALDDDDKDDDDDDDDDKDEDEEDEEEEEAPELRGMTAVQRGSPRSAAGTASAAMPGGGQ